jgi:hypothetical protein
MYRPYIIFTPDFDATSGGIRVMWALYGWLLAKGQIAYINRYPQGEIVAIYPEIAHGNPANAKTVVRYILNTPGKMGSTINGIFTPGPTSFDPSDRLYYFSRIFGWTLNENRYMFLPVLNLHVFKDQGKKRTKTCYLIGKGKNKNCHPKDAIEFTRYFAQDQQALADLLNECHTFYCYDDLTAMMEVARLCGTPVMYFGDYDEDTLKKYEPGMNGVGIGGKKKKLDADAFREHYIGMVREFDRKLDIFIEETQK